MPDGINLRHLFMLCDEVGIVQHTVHGVPDRRHGYSADDAGRGLVVLTGLYRLTRRDDLLPPIRACLAFVHHAQTHTGHFHNMMGYDRRFLDESGSEDTVGRVLWGLGHVVRFGPSRGMARLAWDMVRRSQAVVAALKSPRAMAYAVCGLYAVLGARVDWVAGADLLRNLSSSLLEAYESNRSDGWEWFEGLLAYGNAKMPEAMLLAYRATGDGRYLDAGLRTLDFLIDVTWNGEYFDIVGNRGWFPRGGSMAPFGQQPIDAGYLVEACAAAYEVTRDDRYLSMAEAAYAWFFGRNRLGVRMYDPDSGAVSDGLEADGASSNCGAEAIICFLLGALAIARVRGRGTPISDVNRR